MPLEESVVLGLSKLNRIKSIDAEKRLAVLEPGVRNIVISEAVAELHSGAIPPLRVFADTRSSRHTQMGVCFPYL
jgi:FAD/FMN-containing dehydrogenase